MIKGCFYVYVHRRVSDGAVFYVGKGKGRRLNSDKNRNVWWQRIAEKHGWIAEKLFSDLSEECAFSIERAMIAAHDGKLSNITAGGQGASGLQHSGQTKAKLKSLAKEQWSNFEARERRRLQTLAQWQMPGMREKLKASARARWDKPEQREMIGAIQRGRKQSPEHAAKSRVAKVGKPVSDATRQKLRDAWVLRKARQHEI